MNPVQKSFLSSGAVVVAVCAVLAGLSARDRTDLHTGGIQSSLFEKGRLLASRSNDAPAISEGDYFDEMVSLLKEQYVDPITDETKLTTGAIRGMVVSLENPDCLFMDPKEFKAFTEMQAGRYEGIGVYLRLEIPPSAAKASPSSPEPLASDSPVGTSIPALIVSAVVPGGPADRAGVKVGDSVDTVNGHWVVNPYTLDAFRDLQKQVAAGKQPQQKLIDMRKELRKKIESSMMPLKAKDELTLGTTGSVQVSFDRTKNLINQTISKGSSQMAVVEKEPEGGYALHFFTGASSKLNGESSASHEVLDLRNNPIGDYSEMKRCLSLYVPAGTYGSIVSQKNAAQKPFKLLAGRTGHPVTLLVDQSTSGPAEVFALVLQAKGIATIKGTLPPNRDIIESIPLPDGSGYTLVTGKFQIAKGGAA